MPTRLRYNKSQAAEELGISRPTLDKLIQAGEIKLLLGENGRAFITDGALRAYVKSLEERQEDLRAYAQARAEKIVTRLAEGKRKKAA